MSKLYRPSHRELQVRHDTTRLADRIEATLFREQFTAEDRAFIERLDMFFLATADAEGRPNCSFKGGDPGFVRVTAPSEPGTSGMPSAPAVFLACTLSPMVRMCSGLGPIQVMPWASTISANWAFSDMKP